MILLLFFLLGGLYCPVQKMLGIPCPGCNMTTSLYYLMQGNLRASLYYHALLLPTVLLWGVAGLFRLYHQKKWMERILWIWIGLMLVYYIYRMVYIFPQAPMYFDSSSLIGRIFGIML